MDPRSLALCALLACAYACAPSEGGPIDAGSPPSELTLATSSLSVVRGESTLVVVLVTNSLGTQGSATIGFGPLPNGVSATTAAWQGQSTVSLVVSATAAAAQGTLPVALQASSNGMLVGSTTLMLSVSGVDGSLDPKFGNAGVMALSSLPADAHLAGLAALPDGGWMVGAYENGKSIVLTRVTAAGALDTSFGTEGTVTTPTSSFNTQSTMAASGDGRFAFDVSDTIMTFDADGKAIDAQTFFGASGAFLAFDEVGFFALDTGILRHVDSAGKISMIAFAFAPSAMRSVSPGTVIVSGVDTNDIVLEKVLFDGQSLAPDPTFGSGGIVNPLDSTTSLPLGLDIDGSGRPILALSSQDAIALQAFSAAGVLDTTFGGSIALPSAGPEGISVIASGTSIFVGGWDIPSSDHELLLARFDASGNVENGFGTYGVTTSTFGDATPTMFAINRTGDRICAVGASTLLSFAHFMACYRIIP